jgi:hypothetical protein
MKVSEVNNGRRNFTNTYQWKYLGGDDITTQNSCNYLGFNLNNNWGGQNSNGDDTKRSRIGIITNNENTCSSDDSGVFIGLHGGTGSSRPVYKKQGNGIKEEKYWVRLYVLA